MPRPAPTSAKTHCLLAACEWNLAPLPRKDAYNSRAAWLSSRPCARMISQRRASQSTVARSASGCPSGSAATSRSRQSGTLAARGNTAWLTIRAASKQRSSSAAARSRSFISETVSNHVRMLFVPASRRLPRGSPIEGIRTPSRISPTPPEPFWVPARSTASSSTNAVVQNLHLPPMRHGARTVPIRSASGRSGHCQGWGYPDSEAALDQLVEHRIANRAANLLASIRRRETSFDRPRGLTHNCDENSM